MTTVIVDASVAAKWFLPEPDALAAIATKRPVSDSLYLALAIELGTVVVTADTRWANALTDSAFARFLRRLG
jgi:predicted nucleic acid-binding protein